MINQLEWQNLDTGGHHLSLYFTLPLPASLREIFKTTQNGSTSVSMPFRAPQTMWAWLPIMGSAIGSACTHCPWDSKLHRNLVDPF